MHLRGHWKFRGRNRIPCRSSRILTRQRPFHHLRPDRNAFLSYRLLSNKNSDTDNCPACQTPAENAQPIHILPFLTLTTHSNGGADELALTARIERCTF